MKHHQRSRDKFYQRYYKHSAKLKGINLQNKRLTPKRHINLPMRLYENKNKMIIRLSKKGHNRPLFDRLSISLYNNVMEYLRKQRTTKKKDYNFRRYDPIHGSKQVARCRRLGYLLEERWGHKLDVNVYLSSYLIVWCVPKIRLLFTLDSLVLHRTDGPAVIWKDGSTEWWVKGENITHKITQIIDAHEMDEDYRNWTDGDLIILRFALS